MNKKEELDDDSEDVKKAREGDIEAFGRLVIRHAESVRKFVAKGLQPTEVDDIMQKTWVEVCKYLPGFEGRSLFSTWIKRIALNILLSEKRKPYRGYNFSFLDQSGRAFLERTPDMLIDEDRPDRALDKKEYTQRRISWLNWAINQLSHNHKMVIILQFMEGCSYEEIAQRMDCDMGTVMSRRFYAMQKLAALAKKHNGSWDTPE